MTATEDPIVAAANRLTVTTFIRWGVSQVVCRACSQERAPVAPAIAAIAHTAHMWLTVLRGGSNLGGNDLRGGRATPAEAGHALAHLEYHLLVRQPAVRAGGRRQAGEFGGRARFDDPR